MSITARVRIEDKALEQASMTLTLTMTVEEWRSLMRQMPNSSWPSWKVGVIIAEAIGKVARSVDQIYTETDIKP